MLQNINNCTSELKGTALNSVCTFLACNNWASVKCSPIFKEAQTIQLHANCIYVKKKINIKQTIICLWESLSEINYFERARSAQSHSWGWCESNDQLLSQSAGTGMYPLPRLASLHSPDTSTNHPCNKLSWTMNRNETWSRTEGRKWYWVQISIPFSASSVIRTEGQDRRQYSETSATRTAIFTCLGWWKAIATVSCTDTRNP